MFPFSGKSARRLQTPSGQRAKPAGTCRSCQTLPRTSALWLSDKGSPMSAVGSVVWEGASDLGLSPSQSANLERMLHAVIEMPSADLVGHRADE
jgi:hypothetical protein